MSDYDPNEPPLGWEPDQEPQHDAFVQSVSLSGLPASAGDIPLNLDFPNWMQDNQGMYPLCHAHMSTGCAELLAGLESNGQFPQYSRFATAIWDLIMDGGDARAPAGASIGGSLKTGIKNGYADEKLMPYLSDTVHWTNGIHEEVKQNAALHHYDSVVPGIRDYRSLDAALTSGRCVVGFGLYWTTGWDAVQNTDTLSYMPGGRVRGGHAILAAGWKTVGGDRWPMIHNSHATWGVRRRCAVAPKVWDRILDPRSSPFGAFAITNIKLDDANPQPLDWASWLNAQQFTSGGEVQWW